MVKKTTPDSASPKKKGRVEANEDTGSSASDLDKVFTGKTTFKTDDHKNKLHVEMIILPYNKDGSIYKKQFAAKEMNVIHLLHRQRPSVFYRFMNTLGEYM